MFRDTLAGRDSRLQYIAHTVLVAAAVLIHALVIKDVDLLTGRVVGQTYTTLYDFAFAFVCIVLTLLTTIRRLYDMGTSRWAALFFYVPIPGVSLLLSIVLMIVGSDKTRSTSSGRKQKRQTVLM